jgi:hypothetical protein
MPTDDFAESVQHPNDAKVLPMPELSLFERCIFRALNALLIASIRLPRLPYYVVNGAAIAQFEKHWDQIADLNNENDKLQAYWSDDDPEAPRIPKSSVERDALVDLLNKGVPCMETLHEKIKKLDRELCIQRLTYEKRFARTRSVVNGQNKSDNEPGVLSMASQESVWDMRNPEHSAHLDFRKYLGLIREEIKSQKTAYNNTEKIHGMWKAASWGVRLDEQGARATLLYIQSMNEEKRELLRDALKRYKDQEREPRQEGMTRIVRESRKDSNKSILKEAERVAYLKKMSDLSNAVESIRLATFPVDDYSYASCIIMDAPLLGENYYISAFPAHYPARMETVQMERDIKETLIKMVPDYDPREAWREMCNLGITPKVVILTGMTDMNLFSPKDHEDRRCVKTLNPPPGMDVHQYALAIVQEKDKCNEIKVSLSAEEQMQGAICYANRLLSTILQGAGGETATKDTKDFLHELDLVSKLSITQDDNRIEIPGLGTPLMSPSQPQKRRIHSQDRKPRRLS